MDLVSVSKLKTETIMDLPYSFYVIGSNSLNQLGVESDRKQFTQVVLNKDDNAQLGFVNHITGGNGYYIYTDHTHQVYYAVG